jgi:DNA-binding transcriptional LysR family regulator
MLRQEHCQLIISPRPPDGADMMQKRLFADRYRVFYDPAVRGAPTSKKDYLASEHVTVVYTPNRALDLDAHLLKQGIERRFRVQVPGFAGLPSFILGTPLLATVPGLLHQHLMRGLAYTKAPVPCPEMPMYMIWHLRHQQDPAHRWLRNLIEDLAKPLAIKA